MAAMAAITVILPDGSPLELDEGASGADAAAAIGPGLAKAALAIRAGDETRDLAAPLGDGERIEIVTAKSDGALDLIRHDAAHVMATAVCELYPGTKVSIGPPIEGGFYYDFEFPDGVTVSEADLERIEARMAEHIAADERFERTEVSAAEALERFRAEDQPYKVELIEDLVADEGVETVSLYRNGPFTDLCRGPHAPSTGRIKAVKLNSLAGAYWRGDETRQMLTRIYGTAFFSKQDLAEHAERIEQAKARDHRKLGPQLDLFMFRDESPGMPFWLPQGTVLLDLIEEQVRAQLDKHGYVRIDTPQILDEELWHRSGHYDNYRENMFFAEPAERERDEHARRFAVRPMNCPGACLVFDYGRHSYRELPLRMAEFGRVSRYEREGVLHGLLRVRAFTQDDAHVYCTREQIDGRGRRDLSRRSTSSTRSSASSRSRSSSRPARRSRSASDEEWEEAEAMLSSALERIGRDYRVNPGDGAFYGPKIDFHVTDALGRSWQLGTCQLDFFMPERFDLTYQGADNARTTGR